MIKKISLTGLCIVTAAAFLGYPILGNAADIVNSDTTKPGSSITPIGTPKFNFQPSPEVTIQGKTSDTLFSVAAVHSGSLGKGNGEAYAMSSEASGLFAETGMTALTPIANAGYIPNAYELPDGTKGGEAPAVIPESGEKTGD